MRVDFPNATTLSFWLKTSVEGASWSFYDYLDFQIDGVRSDRWGGETGWINHTVTLAAGAHTLLWSYVRDSSVGGGSDQVWIDDVVFTHSSGSPSPICEP
jgi:hypothetical protein